MRVCDMAILRAGEPPECLILLGKPLSKSLCDLQSVIVDYFFAYGLMADNRLPLFVLFYLFGNLFRNFITPSVTNVCAVAAFIVTNVVREGHEDCVIIHATRCALHRD